MYSIHHADVLVVGMGPAGSTCARLLAELGFHVLGIERAQFPRKKPCGGCITDRALALTGAEIGPAIERTYSGAELVGGDGQILSFSSARPVAYGVSRETFDALLLGMAKRAGVEVRSPEKAAQFSVQGSEVLLVTDRARYAARFLVGADGAGGIVSRTIQGKRKYMVAYETRIPERVVPHDPKIVRMFLGGVRDGYGWMFPKRGYVNAGILARNVNVKTPRRTLERFLSQELGVHENGCLEIAGGLIPRYSPSARITSERILLIGDAGGLCDPFLAEGISYAVLSGSLAAPVIACALHRGDGDLGLYEEAVSNYFPDHFRAAEKIRRSSAYFPGLAFLLMRKRSALHESFFEVIRGNIGYGELAGRLKKAVIGLH
jgi:geranylgeranyl reductase family protein